MRVTSILMAGAFALFANAQSTTDSATSAQSSEQAKITNCISTCTAGDVNCISKCLDVPHPNEQQVNDTTSCVAACPVGQGTEADITRNVECRNGCIGQFFLQPTGAAGSGSGTNGGSGSSGSPNPTGTSGNQPSGSSTGAPASQTSNNPAALLQISGAAAGVVGLVAAIMAL